MSSARGPDTNVRHEQGPSSLVWAIFVVLSRLGPPCSVSVGVILPEHWPPVDWTRDKGADGSFYRPRIQWQQKGLALSRPNMFRRHLRPPRSRRIIPEMTYWVRLEIIAALESAEALCSVCFSETLQYVKHAISSCWFRNSWPSRGPIKTNWWLINNGW